MKGLKNLGNTCYMNAALQALSNIKPFKDFFLNCSIDALKLDLNSSAKCPQLALAFQRFLKEMWLDKPNQYIIPSELLEHVKHTNNYIFDDYTQHDSQEFLKFFIDLLHEELKVVTRSNESEYNNEDQDVTDGEYETCDSAVSEISSLSEDSDFPLAHSTNAHVTNNVIPNDKECMKTVCCDTTTSKDDIVKNYTHVPESPPKETKYKSIISEVFNGKISSSVECLCCNKVSTRLEIFQDLSLPFPSHNIVAHKVSNMQIQTPNASLTILANLLMYQYELFTYLCTYFKQWLRTPVISLSDCLNAFFQDVHFIDKDKYRCENCNGLRDGVQSVKIKELPEVLCIHLKRFRHDSMFSKIQGHVSFPLENLDLTSYLHQSK